MQGAAKFDFSQVHVLDGGLATELEQCGCDISGPLWSAHVLDSTPEIIERVHLEYLRAGADCISTASYQVSAQGYAELGRPAEDAVRALRESVRMAVAARAIYAEESRRPVLIAASLGPYGAALHNGAEFHGLYNIDFAALVEFHALRLRTIAEMRANAPAGGGADLIAFETIPSQEEAWAILEALGRYPGLRAWMSFVCRDAERVVHGEPLAECAALAGRSEQVVAVGVNCTQPEFIGGLVERAITATRKPIIVYPNSGEEWDAVSRRWCGTTSAAEYGAQAAGWFAAGAHAVGGCCRTTPRHIAQVRAAWDNYASLRTAATGAAMRQ